MLCFNKLTGEHNAKKYFKKFSFISLFSYIFNDLNIVLPFKDILPQNAKS